MFYKLKPLIESETTHDIQATPRARPTVREDVMREMLALELMYVTPLSELRQAV